jgi:hypothetical protein
MLVWCFCLLSFSLPLHRALYTTHVSTLPVIWYRLLISNSPLLMLQETEKTTGTNDTTDTMYPFEVMVNQLNSSKEPVTPNLRN